jgi:D-tyrosyl-tRNA(Tyr) deacylase
MQKPGLSVGLFSGLWQFPYWPFNQGACMKAVIQRVSRAAIRCSSGHQEEIGRGHFVLVGISRDDEIADVDFLVKKLPELRLFPDAAGVMNLSLEEMNMTEAGEHATGPANQPGELLVVSQFTLHADTRKGRRPHYGQAAEPDKAIPLYERLIEGLRERGLHVATGVFGDHMEIEARNDGPVTILLDSRNR